MKTPNTLYSRLALTTSITLIMGYFIVSAWTPMEYVGTGNQLSATLWNTFVDNLNDLNTRISTTASTWPTITGGIAYTGGNVGIGTVNPAFPLDVVGGINSSGNVTSGNNVIANGLASAQSFGVNAAITTAPANGTLPANGMFAPLGNTLAFSSASGERMRITTAGNVGIGTTTSSDRLTLSGSTGPIIALNGLTTNYRGLKMSDSAGTEKWFAGANNLENYVIRQDNTTDLMTFSGGNVGIGTTTPGTRLSVIGAAGAVAMSVGASANNWAETVYGSSVASQSYGIQISAGTNSSDVAFRVVNQAQNAEYMYIRGDGNVGIGTATPGVKLEVNGSIKAAGLWDLDSTYFVNPDASGTAGAFNGSVGIGTATPATKLQIYGAGTQAISIAASGISHGITAQAASDIGAIYGGSPTNGGSFIQGLSDGDTTAFRVDAFIGATDPTDTTPAILLQGAKKVTTNVGALGSLETVLQVQNIGTPLMSILGNGSVGIGNINPGSTRLRVTQAIDNQWASYIESISPTTGLNFGLTVRAGTSSADAGFTVMDKTSTNYQLYVRGDGNVGIGTGVPGTRLSVRQSSNTTTGGLGVENVGGVRGFYFWVDDLNRGRIDVASDGSNPLSINSGGGSVGINVLSPSYKLHVNGTAAGTSWTNLSDQRFKKNVTPISFALAKIDKLQGVNFDWRVGEFKDRDFPTGKQVGFIAQEVEKVLPEVVTTDNDGYKGVEYSNITAVLVEAVKELKKENDSLKSLVCLDHPTALVCK